ncbi:flagellar motor protein MotB [Sphingomonas morindae]|uniref:OmpA family protein n=1 Tax=Sphingomonas morindae TaxID=1541170 RepID=A0ABY4X547_9SPHN|nr:flagellar motor protein MotB [Sphingomonas morindae]USI71996.1 OmpA family protein [Sphingomonas morindae]
MSRRPDAEAAPNIIVRRRRAKAHGAAHTGAWKVAYADFVTAMMAFFMLLWLLSSPNKGRHKGLAEYFSTTSVSSPITTQTDQPGSDAGVGGRRRRAQGDVEHALGTPSDEAGRSGASRGGTANIPEASQRILAEEMRIALEPPADAPGANASVKVEPAQNGVRIQLMDNARQTLFVGTTAELNGYGRALLAKVAAKLLSAPVQIAIEGHTDARGGPQSAANWQLSTARALAARAALTAAGLAPDRISEITGKAGTEPIYADRPDRPENRRVTLVLIGEGSAVPHDLNFRF